jgi:hypothetical protein
VFLSIDDAISINWLTSREKFNTGCFCKTMIESISEIRHGGRAAESPRPIVYLDNVIRYGSPATKTTFNFANPKTAPSHPIAGYQSMSLLSIRRSENKFMGEEFDRMEEFHARVEGLLDQLTPERM